MTMRFMNRACRRRGLTLVYTICALLALMAMISMGIDLARVQLARTELRQAADAAARYAALGIADGTCVSRALLAAADNTVDGTPLALRSSDVTVGNWDDTATPAFSTARTPHNAVRVSAERTAARQNPVRLWFGALVGAASCDIRVVCIATSDPLTSGFVGLNGISAKNNLRSLSYNSSVSTDPENGGTYSHGMLGSNGQITAGNNEVVGQVVLGPDGSHNLNLRFSALRLEDPIPAPAIDFSGAPPSNPGGVPRNLAVSGTTTLPAGTYYFNRITLANNATLRFAGPATIYVDGNITFAQSGTIEAFNGIPAHLKIRQRGAGTDFGGSNANSIDVTADIEAPQTDFHAKNNATLRGRAVFNSIDVKNNLDLFYDQSLNATLAGVSQRWPVAVVQ